MGREDQRPDWLLEIEREDARQKRDDKEFHDAMYEDDFKEEGGDKK